MPYTHDSRQSDSPPYPLPPSRRGRHLDDKLEAAARRVAIIRGWFYAVVLLVALGGQITGAVETLGLPWYFAVPAVTALELGGVVVMANADVRRRLGERAAASRLLSAAIAGGAVTFNWLTHSDKKVGGFFAGMSLLGYLVWLMHTENSRRDRLRATGDLPPTTPAYEPVGHWLRHPWVTRRALALAKASPGLGLYPSLEAARAQIRSERRQAALSTVLHRKIRKALDADTADIAVAVYDLDEIARRLAGRADYDGLTALIAADLAPARVLAGNQPTRASRRWWRRRATGPDAAAVASAQQLITELLAAQPDQRPATEAATAIEAVSDQPALPAAHHDRPDTAQADRAQADRAQADRAQADHARPDAAAAGGGGGGADARRTHADGADASEADGDGQDRDGTADIPSTPSEAEAAVAGAVPVRGAEKAPSRLGEWEQVQRELAELMPATRRRADMDTAARGRDLPDLVRAAVDRTSAALAAAPAEIPQQPSEPKPNSLRGQVYAALDRLVPAGDQRDNSTLTGLVVEHLGLDPRVRGTAAKYVRGWRADVAAGRRTPSAARRLRAVPRSS